MLKFLIGGVLNVLDVILRWGFYCDIYSCRVWVFIILVYVIKVRSVIDKSDVHERQSFSNRLVELNISNVAKNHITIKSIIR